MGNSNIPNHVILAYDKETTRHTIVFILMTYQACLQLCSSLNIKQGRYIFSTLEQSEVRFYQKHSNLVYSFDSLDGIYKVN